MATILGTVGVFGLEEDQQGIILESQDVTYKPDTKIQKDYQGKKIGIIFYDDQTDVSLKGYIPRTDATAIMVGTSLTLANALPVHGLATDMSTGTTAIMEIKVGLKNEDLATFEVSATHFDF